MKKFRLILIITLGLCLMGQWSWAERAYITDSFKITLRTGPSSENKVIAMPTSGEAVEVLDSQDNWTHIRLLDRGQGTLDGWVLSRYLIDRLPWELQAGNLKAENSRIKDKLTLIQSEQGEAAGREQELTGELKKNSEALKKLQTEYESLKQGATDYLNLKKEYDTTRSKLETIQKTAQTLTADNERLRSSQRNRWFATGAAVLLIGMIIGLVLGRREKKRKSLYY
ncbi:MAG: TIGR04211 family SH3 domain-containing protein [Desulfobacteraceae bacterium]|nr:MAG: TIGR04211 family SH3 domain-containing protein [Desulfobacteraceae bacterium]